AGTEPQGHPQLLAADPRQALGEQLRVPAGVAEVSYGSCDLLLDGLEGRIEPRDLRGIENLLALPVLCQERHLPHACLELARIAVEIERAAVPRVIVDPLCPDELGHDCLAVLAEAQLHESISTGTVGGALTEKPDPPRDQRRIEPRAHADRGLVPEERAQEHPRGRGGGPGERMTRRDDPGVRGTRVPADTILLLEERDLVPVLGQEVGGRDAGDAATQNEHSHRWSTDARIR